MHSDLPGGREKSKGKKDGETKRSRGRPPLPKGLRCEKCNTTDTPEWRVGENGPHTLCNACGLQYAKKKKVEIESKAKHSIKNILNENEPAAAAVAEAVQRGQQDFLLHNSTYGKTTAGSDSRLPPSYKNKRPSALAISSPAGSPMLTRASSTPSSGSSSPMAFAPSSPFNIPNYFSAMTLSSPTGTPTSTPPPPPFAGPASPAIPRMSPFNPASHSPSLSPSSSFPHPPFSDPPTFFMSEGGRVSPHAPSPSPSVSLPFLVSEKLTQMETAAVLSSFTPLPSPSLSPSHSPSPSLSSSLSLSSSQGSRSSPPFVLLPDKPLDKFGGPNLPPYVAAHGGPNFSTNGSVSPNFSSPNFATHSFNGPNFNNNHPVFSSSNNPPISKSHDGHVISSHHTPTSPSHVSHPPAPF